PHQHAPRSQPIDRDNGTEKQRQQKCHLEKGPRTDLLLGQADRLTLRSNMTPRTPAQTKHGASLSAGYSCIRKRNVGKTTHRIVTGSTTDDTAAT
uniref:Uncharacterized protein n=1 Tax=Anopheles atroparvus TaxID=41427 RepID=A0AAG5DQU0_ANOAO